MKKHARPGSGGTVGSLMHGQGRGARNLAPAAPVGPSALLNQAVAFHRNGQLAQAEQLYRQVLQAQPRHFDGLHLLGVVRHQRGEYADAVRQIRAALKINPGSAAANNNLGAALKELGRHGEALESYDRAIAIQPDYAEAFNNRGLALVALKRFAEALGSCDRAVALRPDFAEAFNSRGLTLAELERLAEAIESYDRAIALRPDFAEAISNRAAALNGLQRFTEALACCEKAIALKPDFAEVFYNRGNALHALKRFTAAIGDYDRAIALRHDYADAFYNRGTALVELKQLEPALASYHRAFALAPELDYLRGDRLHVKMHLCDWSDLDADCADLDAALRKGKRASSPFPLLATRASAQTQLACARRFIAVRHPGAEPLWRGERYHHGRIRLAYVSADFRDHPVSSLAAGLFETHDRSRFEVVGLSFGPDDPSETRSRLKAAFDRFIDVQDRSDRDAASLLRELEVDIAVDLMGLTADGRPGIFAARPGPVQVNYLGYAGTMGADYIDYLIADRFVVPPDQHANFAEKVVYLPDSFQANDATRRISESTPSRAEAGLPDHGFVFGCFNNAFKITPDVFDVWMRLLGATEGSVLWLSAGGSARDNLRCEAAHRGIAADRLIFAPRTPLMEDHLARYRLADLFLDTLHFNAHTTASDALWAGLPVLSCAGATYAGRVAGSLLHAVGLPELVAHSLGDYEALALRLAREPALLASFRQRLARHRRTFPLFDTTRFTRHLEAAYTAMWERQQRGEPPQSFAVPASSTDQAKSG
jgi:predicted O-linked N-acetylglucosamine transferase (SPINDLY family)